jgi:hypothetical protein
MNRDDVMRMAREARLAEHTHPYELWSASDDGLERFANLVAAAEREKCALLCDKISDEDGFEGGYAGYCADMIRAREQG